MQHKRELSPIEKRMVHYDELNLRYEGKYKIEYYNKDIYTSEKFEVIIDDADCAEDALVGAECHAFNEGIDLDEYGINIYTWIPKTLYYEGGWEEVDLESKKEMEEMQERFKGKTIKEIKPKIQYDDRIAELEIVFTDMDSFTIHVEDERFLGILRLPF